MLRLPPDSLRLTDAERYALAVLVDGSRILPAASHVDAVQLTLSDDTSTIAVDQLRAQGWLIESGDGEVRIGRALLRAIVDVAGAVTEHRSRDRDRFDRIPSAASPIVAAKSERAPLFADACAELRRAVLAAAQRRPVRLLAPWPDGRRWAAALSHDLDVVDKWPVFTALRLAELAKKGQFAQALRVVGAAAAAVPQRPTLGGVQDVLRIEREAGVRSTWFILCGDPTFRTMRAGDLTYNPEGRASRRILAAIKTDGHEFGLHGSFDTCTNAELFASQRQRLAKLVESDIRGVRQHYLRMRPGATHRAMREAGFTFDSTCGFADRNGFRLGFADVIGAWDPEADAPIDLAEAPFAWMDRAMSKYQSIEDPARWVADGLELADACRAVQGMWIGIWHPNLTAPLGFPGAVAAYDTLVRSLIDRGAFVAPIGELVAWREARRRARATAIRPDGTVDVELPVAPPGARTFVLEDEHDRPVQTLTSSR